MAEMKLSSLKPKLTKYHLRFQCPTSFDDPNDKDRDGHSIVTPIHKNGITRDVPYVWKKTGDSIDNISLFPSVDCTGSKACKFHGHVKNGKVIW